MPIAVRRDFNRFRCSEPSGVAFQRRISGGWRVVPTANAFSVKQPQLPLKVLYSCGIIGATFPLLREALETVRLATGIDVCLAPRRVRCWTSKDGRFVFEQVTTSELKDAWIVEAPFSDPFEDGKDEPDWENWLEAQGFYGKTFATLAEARQALAGALAEAGEQV